MHAFSAVEAQRGACEPSIIPDANAPSRAPVCYTAFARGNLRIIDGLHLRKQFPRYELPFPLAVDNLVVHIQITRFGIAVL
jgi:hypothetical protein